VIVGGHVTAIPGIEHMVDADHYVRGEGISWMRRYLGEDDSAPIKHPAIVSGLRTRAMGMRLPERRGSTAATIIPSVGCPMGCSFCTTSSFFGGKGNFYNFYETGDELFDIMDGFESSLGVQTFFIMDENFLLHRKRALQLLERMKAAGKSWGMAVFASANAIKAYSMEELVELGISWVWMGLESAHSVYTKLKGTDTRELTHELRSHGIRVQGSTIIGLEHHTPANITDEIEHACSHETDFHQFMLYTPVPGTPLYREDSKRFLDWAFWHDFESNGPSLYRMCQTMLQGWRRYRDYPDPRVRERFARAMQKLRTGYSAALWAMEHQFRSVNRSVSEKMKALRKDVESASGIFARFSSRAL